MRRRRVSSARSWPVAQARDVVLAEHAPLAHGRGPEQLLHERRERPQSPVREGTLMPNFRRQTMSSGSLSCSASLRTYFSQAPWSFS